MNYLRNAVRKEDSSALFEACELLDRLQCGLNASVVIAERQVIARRAGMSKTLSDAVGIERKALSRMDGCESARATLKGFLETLLDDGPVRIRTDKELKVNFCQV